MSSILYYHMFYVHWNFVYVFNCSHLNISNVHVRIIYKASYFAGFSNSNVKTKLTQKLNIILETRLVVGNHMLCHLHNIQLLDRSWPESLNRITHHLLNGIVSWSQCGLKRNPGTVDMVFAVRHL